MTTNVLTTVIRRVVCCGATSEETGEEFLSGGKKRTLVQLIVRSNTAIKEMERAVSGHTMKNTERTPWDGKMLVSICRDRSSKCDLPLTLSSHVTVD